MHSIRNNLKNNRIYNLLVDGLAIFLCQAGLSFYFDTF